MSIDLTDWRIQYIGTVAGTTNRAFVGVKGRWKNNAILSAVMPSPSALMLGSAFTAYTKACELSDTLRPPADGQPVQETAAIFDYIQAYFEAVICSFTSLEIACNLHIQSTDELVVSGRRSTETYVGEQIERWVHLDDKIEFVANQLGAPIDKGQAIWANYKRLGSMRDRIIHLKNSDRESHSPDEDNVWSFALNSEPLHVCQVALDVLTALYASKESPRWLTEAITLHDGLSHSA